MEEDEVGPLECFKGETGIEGGGRVRNLGREGRAVGMGVEVTDGRR